MWAMRDKGRAEAKRDEHREVMDRFAQRVIDWRMTAVAIMFLESTKPLSFLGNQALIFFQPIVQSIFNFKSYDEVAEILEDRENIEYLLCKIEALEAERRDAERDGKRKKREEKLAAKRLKEGS